MSDEALPGDEALGAKWGDKSVTARGSLAIAALVVLVFGAQTAFAIWWAGNAIREVGTKIAESQSTGFAAIAKSNTDGFEKVLATLRSMEQGQKVQHEGIEAQQGLLACLSSYDFASRQRLRQRAENGELNLDAWCRWMRTLDSGSRAWPAGKP